MRCKPEFLSYHLGAHVRAFSTLRTGGCSTGPYASFNVNAWCGDDENSVRRNREALCDELGIADERLIVPHQIHGDRVVRVDESFFAQDTSVCHALLEGADAVTTDCSRTCVAVSTADCIPVLLCDEARHAVAAVHAGWRGTVLRIAETVLESMHTAYGTKPEEVTAVIGPGISIAAFEVGDEVCDAFAAAGFDMNKISRRFPAASAPAEEKWHIDLWEANRLSLLRAGIQPQRIHLAGICTYTHSGRFFSARRAGIRSGRILNGILFID